MLVTFHFFLVNKERQNEKKTHLFRGAILGQFPEFCGINPWKARFHQINFENSDFYLSIKKGDAYICNQIFYVLLCRKTTVK